MELCGSSLIFHFLSCGHRNPDPDGIGDPWTLTGDCPGLPDGRTGLILRWLRGLDGWFDPEVIVWPLVKRQLSLILFDIIIIIIIIVYYLFDLVNSIKTKGNG